MKTKQETLDVLPTGTESMRIYTDGACRGNPGPGAFAYIFCDPSDQIIFQKKKYLSEITNNIAEYEAIIDALREAAKFTNGLIELYSDSKLAINQLKGKWKIKAEHLRKLHEKVKSLEHKFQKVSYIHTRRSNKYITIADEMCNHCLDEKS